MQADQLRQKFLDFFESKAHKVVESDSLVPKDDPTVLFTPAGMNQFKKEFLGFDSGFKRASSSQRCLRTDDLDKVGITPVHHTFFEMLGNFSFGDYFKKEAITWAWEFLTKELKIPEGKLWVSVYKDDEEAYKIWKDDIKVTENKIIKLGDHDNFWPADAKEKGPNGPCGPCSEIFYDFGEGIGCQEKVCDPTCSCGRFAEIWNLVFTQFNRKEGALLEPLPNKNIDTGMGLERLTAVMEGKLNNFETELFQPIIKEIAKSAKIDTEEKKRFSFAIADHIRAVVLAIFDGVFPSNESRGYVIRKLIRKSVLHLQAVGIKGPFLHKLVPVVAEIMQVPYPGLKPRVQELEQIVLLEENNFISTLDSSQVLFGEKFKGLGKSADPKKIGAIAFQLYDTYGIPLELTREYLIQHGVDLSMEVFNRELEVQKTRSKVQSAMKGDVFSDKGIDKGVKETEFIGYGESESKATVLRVVIDKEQVTLVLDKTPFYAESGGQVGDTGQILNGDNIFEVLDTKKFGNVNVHIGRIKSGSFKEADSVVAKVNNQRRLAIARNHTATHILQAVLREVLGKQVRQQGSLVAQDKLRFDFTHFKALTENEISEIEKKVNDYIKRALPLYKKEMSLSEAKQEGALAFFGEKYSDKVRVISIGALSKELCGGTHLDSTKEVGLFKIVREGSVASGVRRIEAVTGEAALKFIEEQEEKSRQEQKRLKEQEEKSAKIKAKENSRDFEEILKNSEEINHNFVIIGLHNELESGSLRKLVDLAKERNKAKTIVAVASGSNIVIGLTEDLIQSGIDAPKIFNIISGVTGGKGGGRADFVQAGGINPDLLEKAFDKLRKTLRELK